MSHAQRDEGIKGDFQLKRRETPVTDNWVTGLPNSETSKESIVGMLSSATAKWAKIMGELGSQNISHQERAHLKDELAAVFDELIAAMMQSQDTWDDEDQQAWVFHCELDKRKGHR